MNIANLILKIAALLIACGFLYVYWLRRDAGRYVPFEPKESISILDTENGTLFACTSAQGQLKCAEIQPQTSRVK